MLIPTAPSTEEFAFSPFAPRLPEVRALAELEARGGPDEQAAWLAMEGIRGQRNSMTCCPVVRYLRRKLGALFIVDPSPKVGLVRDRWTLAAVAELPPGVNELALRFDAGRYPGLVDNENED